MIVDMNRTEHLVGSMAVVFRTIDGKECVLLGKRKGGAGEGQWGICGGHLETEEMLGECAVRELYEEAGLVGTNPLFLCTAHCHQKSREINGTMSDPKNYIQIAFRVEVPTDAEPKNMEPEHCYEWRFFPVHDLPSPLFFAHKGILDMMQKGEVFRDEGVL
jgi:8-oxo-dGTP diphosphatase